MVGSLLLGLLTGLNIALIGMGIVLIFKTGKYINFAQAQLGIIPMLILGKMVLDWHLSWYLAVVIALVLGAAISVVCEVLVVRPLAKLGPETVLVATLGISQLLLGLAYIKQLGAPQVKLISNGYPVPFNSHFDVQGVTFFAQHLLTLIIVPVFSFFLWVFLKQTLTGKSIRAAACNEEAAKLAGLNISRLSMSAWAIAGVLATTGAVLDAPNNPGFDPSSVGPGLMFSALGAAALAGFSSFPQVVASSVLLSCIQAAVVHQTSDTGKGSLSLLIAVVVGLLLRYRSTVMRQLSNASGTAGRLRPGFTPAFRATRQGRGSALAGPAVLIILALVLFAFFNNDEAKLFRVDQTLVICIVAASVSLLGGITGQLSLGQYAFTGVGAAFTARLVLHGHHSLIVNTIIAAAICAVLAVAVSLPSARGGALLPAVTTLGFAVIASSYIFNLPYFASPDGSLGTVNVDAQTLPGGKGIVSGHAIYFVLLIATVLLVVLGRILQRSRWGVKMAAVRFSAQGSRSMGINVMIVRLLAVAAAGAITGAAGGLDVMSNASFTATSYNPQISLVLISIVIIGGLGSVTGAVVVTIFIFGVPLFLTDVITKIGGNATQIQLLLGGAALIVNLLSNPGGLATVGADMMEKWFGKKRAPVSGGGLSAAVGLSKAADHRTPSFESPVLVTTDVSKSFGVVKALTDVSVTVGQHEIVGLIGNNGAGKTTLLNCIAGDMPSTGGIQILGRDVSRMSPRARARLGLGRTFQDAGLFAGLTTREVVELASRKAVKAEGGAQRTAKVSAQSRADEVLSQLGLLPYEHALTAELPTGIRRLVELGIQLARRPKLILLDEPAAGLSQAEVEHFGPLLRSIVNDLGCSVLMIEHDLPMMLSIADRIYCLELGKVIAEGDPAEIRSNPAVIESYFGSPDGVGARRSGSLDPEAVVESLT